MSTSPALSITSNEPAKCGPPMVFTRWSIRPKCSVAASTRRNRRGVVLHRSGDRDHADPQRPKVTLGGRQRRGVTPVDDHRGALATQADGTGAADARIGRRAGHHGDPAAESPAVLIVSHGSVVTVTVGRGQILRHAVSARARVVPRPRRRLVRAGERPDDALGGRVRRTLQDDGGHAAQRTGVAASEFFLSPSCARSERVDQMRVRSSMRGRRGARVRALRQPSQTPLP